MAALTDEILMAYADGALDQETRTRVEALLHQDAESRRRVEVFRATGVSLAKLFDKPMQEPVPSHLVTFVRFYGGERPAPSKPRFSFKILTSWWHRLTPGAGEMPWRLVAASAAGLVIGASSVWMLRGEVPDNGHGQGLATLEHGEIFAQGPLQQILEKFPSGREVRISGSSQDSTVVRASLTFKNNEGAYCREYEMATPAEGKFAGLACRQSGGKWTVQVHIAEGAKSAALSPAGRGLEILEPVVDRIIDGDALGKKEEETAIANGWKCAGSSLAGSAC